MHMQEAKYATHLCSHTHYTHSTEFKHVTRERNRVMPQSTVRHENSPFHLSPGQKYLLDRGEFFVTIACSVMFKICKSIMQQKEKEKERKMHSNEAKMFMCVKEICMFEKGVFCLRDIDILHFRKQLCALCIVVESYERMHEMHINIKEMKEPRNEKVSIKMK